MIPIYLVIGNDYGKLTAEVMEELSVMRNSAVIDGFIHMCLQFLVIISDWDSTCIPPCAPSEGFTVIIEGCYYSESYQIR
jgi:hypothetical protein